MCSRIGVSVIKRRDQVLDSFLEDIRELYDNGGAFLSGFDISPDSVFDWFASRNRLSEDGLLDSLLLNPAIRNALPDIYGNAPQKIETGLAFYDPFMLDGVLLRILYYGGAYSKNEGDGRAEKAFAIHVCEAMFESRFGEVSCYLTHKAWSSWFKDVAWDLTVAVFDRRTRRLWILATTDTD
jgi:hypothetical protein